MNMSPLFLSLKTALTATFITFFLGIYAARLVLNVPKKFRAVLDGIFTLPLVLPPTVVGFLLLVIFGKNSLIGQALMSVGIRIVFSWSATVIAAVIVSFPLMYRTARGSFEQLDRNIISAARTIRMSERKIFWRIIIPNCIPSITAGTVLSFTRALGEFGATLMIAGNIPNKTQTISLAIYTAVSSGDMDKALVWVIVISIINFGVIFIMNLCNKSGVRR